MKIIISKFHVFIVIYFLVITKYQKKILSRNSYFIGECAIYKFALKNTHK